MKRSRAASTASRKSGSGSRSVARFAVWPRSGAVFGQALRPKSLGAHS
jgi:hypothetical protein